MRKISDMQAAAATAGEAAAAAAAVPEPMDVGRRSRSVSMDLGLAAPVTPTLPGGRWCAAGDLWLEFNADPALLPTTAGTRPQLELAALNVLAALYIAVPWGAQLPALSFEAMGVSPPMVHTWWGTPSGKSAGGSDRGGSTTPTWCPSSSPTSSNGSRSSPPYKCCRTTWRKGKFDTRQ